MEQRTNAPVDYLLLRSVRQRLQVRVTSRAQVEVRAPLRLPLTEIEAFLHRQADWLDHHLTLARAHLASLPPIEDGLPLPCLGQTLTLRLKGDRAGRTRQVGQEVWLPLANQPLTGLARERALALLERWYRQRARRELGCKLAHWAVPMAVTPAALTIRAQRARWGSCSAKGAISLNWRLLLLPDAVADYVVIHELAHLQHHHHGPAFWQLVARFDPHFARHQTLLKSFRNPW